MKAFLGTRLKELRVDMVLTQKQVAEKLDINSVTYLHYEKGQREPRPYPYLQILQIFTAYLSIIF